MGGACVGCGDRPYEASVLVNVGKKFSTIRARIGATDKSPSTEKANVEILAISNGTARSIYNKSFAIGQYDDAELAVGDAVQLKFIFSGPLGRVYAGVGDPVGYR